MAFDDHFNTKQKVSLNAPSTFILQIQKAILISQDKMKPQ